MRFGERIWLSSVLALGLAAIVLAPGVSAQPPFKVTPVPVDNLPKELVKIVKRSFPRGKITSAESYHHAMDEGGSMGVTVMDGKQAFQVGINCMNAYYQINSISRDVAPSALPNFVLKAVHAKYPHAKINSARETQDGLMGWARDYSKPANFNLRITTTNDEELDLLLSPTWKTNADGDARPETGKVYIERETSVEKVGNKRP